LGGSNEEGDKRRGAEDSKGEPHPRIVILLSAKLCIGCHSASRHDYRKLQSHFVSPSGKMSLDFPNLGKNLSKGWKKDASSFFPSRKARVFFVFPLKA